MGIPGIPRKKYPRFEQRSSRKVRESEINIFNRKVGIGHPNPSPTPVRGKNLLPQLTQQQERQANTNAEHRFEIRNDLINHKFVKSGHSLG